MKDDSHSSFSISRRTFLTLSVAFTWPFYDASATHRPLLIAMSEEQRNRKEHFLAQKRPTTASSIADAIVLKDDNVFFVAQPDGNVPVEGGHGYGLYYHDCRFLNGYEFRLSGSLAPALGASATPGFMGQFELTNPDVQTSDGKSVKKESIGIRWQRIIDSRHLALHDSVTFEHYGRQTADFPVSFTFRSTFEDLYTVKGTLQEPLGVQREHRWIDGMLHYFYEGKDGIYRSLTVHFSPPVEQTDGETARFRVTLGPDEKKQWLISLVIRESRDAREVQPQPLKEPDLKQLETELHQEAQAWMQSVTEITSDSFVLQQIMIRSLRDLRVLRSTLKEETFFAGGVPWFVTIFGRDSLITAFQMLAFDPDISAQTLRLMAKYQGNKVDEWCDEQPGKILHELRVGEAAHVGLIPHTPYYGTIDATPLFLVLLGAHADWTGSLSLFQELRSPVDRALDWLNRYGDRHGEAFVAYDSSSTSKQRLINQGWKDSGDAIVNADGSIAKPAIALVEVQGYAYRAKLAIADLFDRAGESERAAGLRQEAERLRRRFNRSFWLEDLSFYALALQGDGQPAAVVSSNPGQALWSGIVDPEKAARTAKRLMADDLFCGWGVRTLSAKERAYNPLSYHLGSVWPHDNSLIAAGLRRYGFDNEALRIFNGLSQAAIHFKAYQLPELFCGFDQRDYHVPIPYPVADHPQAWASGSMPYFVSTLLGLVPEAFNRRLRIVRPILPESAHTLELHRLRVGHAKVDLRFERARDGQVLVHVLKTEGDLKVIVEPPSRVLR
jgi:glycogen debranching enzyme